MLPLLVAPVQVTVTLVLPAVADTPVGALGAPIGVTELDEPDCGELPIAFVANTLKV